MCGKRSVYPEIILFTSPFQYSSTNLKGREKTIHEELIYLSLAVFELAITLMSSEISISITTLSYYQF